MKKVACIGECMIEMLQMPDGNYKAKYAGDTFNTAQYLAWLGEGPEKEFSGKNAIQASYVTVLGRDKFGRDMLKDWSENGIDTSLVMTTSEKNTGLYFADVDDIGNRDYTYFRSDSAARQIFNMRHSEALFSKILQDYDVVFASAISLMILEDKDKQNLIDFFQTAKSKGLWTVFDTNYRVQGWASNTEAAKWVDSIMPHVTLALPTDEDCQKIYGDYRPSETLKRFEARGVKEIAVKCGGEECRISYENEHFSIPAEPDITVVDTISAGDSFNAGYLFGRLHGLHPREAAKCGHRLAAQVIQYRGSIIPREKIPHFDIAREAQAPEIQAAAE